jgi:hypothetical protein
MTINAAVNLNIIVDYIDNGQTSAPDQETKPTWESQYFC